MKQQIYPLYNQDYQDYKQRFDKGLNFRVFSKDKSINHNFSQTIKNNKDSITLGNYTESIHKTHSQNIALTKSVKVGGEYLTNVTLSKDTFVGLSNTLNVGASNSLRVTGDSSESIGGERKVEVGGSSKEEVGGDKTEIIEGDSKNHINKGYEIYATNGISLNTQQQFNLSSNNYIIVSSNEDLSLQTKKQLTQTADSSYANIESNYEMQAGNQITHQVGETTITATSDSVIIKAGGVEVTIDSKGLIVKGGEVKSE